MVAPLHFESQNFAIRKLQNYIAQFIVLVENCICYSLSDNCNKFNNENFTSDELRGMQFNCLFEWHNVLEVICLLVKYYVPLAYINKVIKL